MRMLCVIDGPENFRRRTEKEIPREIILSEIQLLEQM